MTAQTKQHPQYELHLPPRPEIDSAIKKAHDELFSALAHFIGTVPLDETPYQARDVAQLLRHLDTAAAVLPRNPLTQPAREEIDGLTAALKRMPTDRALTNGRFISGPLVDAMRSLERCKPEPELKRDQTKRRRRSFKM